MSGHGGARAIRVEVAPMWAVSAGAAVAVCMALLPVAVRAAPGMGTAAAPGPVVAPEPGVVPALGIGNGARVGSVAVPVPAAAPPCFFDLAANGPGVVLQGDTFDISIDARAACVYSVPLHMMFVMDASGSMARYLTPGAEAEQAAQTMIQSLGMGGPTPREVGVIESQATAKLRCPLTGDEAHAVACVRGLRAEGGSQIDLGIQEATRILRRARGADGAPLGEAIVVVSDGSNNSGCGPVERTSEQARGMGMTVAAVCVGPDCDTKCMRSIASSPQDYLEASRTTDLAQWASAYATTATRHIRSMSVRAVPPAGLVVTGAEPPATGPDEWTFGPGDAEQITLHMRAAATGTQPLLDRLEMTADDWYGQHTFAAPWMPTITVLGP